MKKRFLSLLLGIVLILSLGTTFVIYHIDQAISSLDHLVERYEKERKCTQILIATKKVQQDILLHNSYSEEELSAIPARFSQFVHRRASCGTCHHPESIANKIRDFSEFGKEFEEVALAVFTHSGESGNHVLDVQAFTMGQKFAEQSQALFRLSAEQLVGETSVARSLTVESKVMLYIITCLGLVFVLFTSFMLIRSFTRPLQSLLTATARIKQGDLDYRVQGLKYEFGELADSFNLMSVSLKKQMVKLRESEQLAACGKIATSLVHEVRNPLAGIKAAMDVLAAESSIAKEDRQILSQVVIEVQRIEGLFTNMLDFARPQPPRYTEVDICEVLAQTLLFIPALTNKEVELDWQREHALPLIQADANQLHQVFLNLLLNATAAMAGGGVLSLDVAVAADGQALQVLVSDTGSGIDEEVLGKIFKPFFTTKPKGSGLGLATCRTLIGLHHGTITVANRAGGGAVFRIILPIQGSEV